MVLDLEVNKGHFHDCFLRRFTPERYIAVEPTLPLAGELLGRGLEVVEAAVAPATGPISCGRRQ